jgi:hypothetical protein
MVEGGREMRLPRLRPSLRSGFQLTAMTGKKDCNAPPFVIARHSPSVIARSISDEAITKLNPKLEALNPKQILISKFKVQNPFGHWDFGHLMLFSISDLGFGISSSRSFER